jgi:hypothetical protein
LFVSAADLRCARVSGEPSTAALSGPADLEEALAIAGLAPELLCLEITERAVMADPGAAGPRLVRVVCPLHQRA